MVISDDDNDENLPVSSIQPEVNKNQELAIQSIKRPYIYTKGCYMYPCKKCDRKFNRPHKLYAHTKSVHEGIRDHKCDRCEKSYITAHELKAHTRTHTGK